MILKITAFLAADTNGAGVQKWLNAGHEVSREDALSIGCADSGFSRADMDAVLRAWEYVPLALTSADVKERNT